MVVGNSVINSPSDGSVRPVANGLLVFSDPSETADEGDYLLPVPAPANGSTHKVGDSIPLTLTTSGGAKPPAKTSILWGTRDGKGFISQQGIFTATRPGKARITARLGSRQWETELTIEAASIP